MKPNWKNYNDVYDMYINGERVQRLWGKKHAIQQAKQQSGGLFGERQVELYNIYTGELIYEN